METDDAHVADGQVHQLSTINHQLLKLASVIGLAPIRPGLKDRLLELLCIHGLEM